MKNKSKYIAYSNSDKTLPIFMQPYWLDAVCGCDNWDVAIVEKDKKVKAVLPYYLKTKFGIKTIVLPKLTQFMGVWFTEEKSKYATKLSREKKYIDELIEQLPNVNIFYQNFNHKINNWLPLYWKGYKQTTSVTYIIEKTQSIADAWDNTMSNIKGAVRKAEKLELEVIETSDVEAFYNVNKLTFERQSIQIPYTLGFIKHLDEALSIEGRRKILLAKDKEGNIHAGVYLIWDNNTVYYLMGGADPDLRSSGATPYLLWEGVKFALNNKKDFDFEGSMLEPVEMFVRSFGAKQKQTFKITKFSSVLFEIIWRFKQS